MPGIGDPMTPQEHDATDLYEERLERVEGGAITEPRPDGVGKDGSQGGSADEASTEQSREHVRDGDHHENVEAGSSPRVHPEAGAVQTPDEWQKAALLGPMWRKEAMSDAKDALACGDTAAAWAALNRHEQILSEAPSPPSQNSEALIEELREAVAFLRSCELSGEHGADHPRVLDALEASEPRRRALNTRAIAPGAEQVDPSVGQGHGTTRRRGGVDADHRHWRT